MAQKKEGIKDELYGGGVRENLEEFAEKGKEGTGWDAIPEDEREEWFTRLKFWSVFHYRGGQESYFMIRLTNCGGVLEPEQLRVIGEVARDCARGPAENPEFGNGWVDFTTRQSIQLNYPCVLAYFNYRRKMGLPFRRRDVQIRRAYLPPPRPRFPQVPTFLAPWGRGLGYP